MEQKIPEALARYIKRIGAEQVNFRKFQIIENLGKYYTEKVFIYLEQDGTIKCSRKSDEPTKEEAASIKAACDGIKFPVSIGASASNVRALLKQLGCDKDSLFVFYTRHPKENEGNILMCQQRVDDEWGGKRYVPWTFFSDGRWLNMELDGKLPFFKPEKERSKFIMVHEGAKAARYAENLCVSNEPYFKELRKRHPWAEELKNYEHWGIIGGALAPHRTDFSELKKVGPSSVTYFCDNDNPGKSVLSVVSQKYAGKMRGIKVEETIFPPSWDIADEIPPNHPKLWSSEGTYIGPTLKDMIVPATYATKLVPDESGKKFVPQLRKEFAEEWIHCLRPDIYCHIDAPWIHYSEEEFNDKVFPFSDTKRTSDLIKKMDEFKVECLAYDPSLPPGIVIGKYGLGENIRRLNTHMPARIRACAGDIGPWLEFMEYLIPVEEDRAHVMKWVATLVARPDVKMAYSMLLISNTQGVGKTTLAEHVLKPLVGHANVSTPKEREIVESSFNGWVSCKRLAIISEIYAGHSSKAYNNLKDIVTDSTIRVNEKFEKAYEVENWIHIFASSNDERALKIDGADRRWLIPAVAEEPKSPEWWRRFYNWLEKNGGLSIIKWWSEDYIKRHGFVGPEDRAPHTSRKKEIKISTMSEGQLLVANKLRELADKYVGQKIATIDADFVELIKREIHNGRHSDYLEKPSTIRKLAKDEENGKWFISDTRMRIDQRTFAHVITNDHSVLSKSWNEVIEKAKIIRLDAQDHEHERLQAL